MARSKKKFHEGFRANFAFCAHQIILFLLPFVLGKFLLVVARSIKRFHEGLREGFHSGLTPPSCCTCIGMSQAPGKKNEKEGRQYEIVFVLENIVFVMGDGATQLWLGTVGVG